MEIDRIFSPPTVHPPLTNRHKSMLLSIVYNILCIVYCYSPHISVKSLKCQQSSTHSRTFILVNSQQTHMDLGLGINRNTQRKPICSWRMCKHCRARLKVRMKPGSLELWGSWTTSCITVPLYKIDCIFHRNR